MNSYKSIVMDSKASEVLKFWKSITKKPEDSASTKIIGNYWKIVKMWYRILFLILNTLIFDKNKA